MNEDEKYMARCIQLARNGHRHAAPNPMVGAVIVCDGHIIGEGYHIRCGEAHAEVNAVRSVKDESLLCRSTIYVSLEPCSHKGRTPPCADLIISKGIPRAVVGCIDPFSKVSGKGIAKLRAAGIEVTVGVLEQECLRLNNRFITHNLYKRPYVILKWAQSADGFIDKKRSSYTESPVVLSTPLTSMLVHKQRAEVQAILVGRRTALLDNPSLTVRHWPGSPLLRVVIDRNLTLPHNLHLFDGKSSTIVFTEQTSTPILSNVEYYSIDFSINILPQILSILNTRGIQTLLVEGGTTLLQSFIDSALWDEACVEIAPMILGKGVPSPIMPVGVYKESERCFGHTKVYYWQEVFNNA